MTKKASHKTSRPRKARSDSTAAAVKVLMAAGKPIQPPAHIDMTEQDLLFFNSAIKEYARSEWTDHQLECAALLARTMSDLVNDQNELRRQGTIQYTEKGHPFINPLKGAVNQSAGALQAFRRSLSLHARVRAGDSRDVASRQDALRKQEQAFDQADDLLARPHLLN